MIDLFPAIARLDLLATAVQNLARQARADRWPPRALAEVERLGRLLEEHAGALDTADDRESARAALAAARAILHSAYASLGRAIADDLATGVRWHSWRSRK
jgi:hypothetical protein